MTKTAPASAAAAAPDAGAAAAPKRARTLKGAARIRADLRSVLAQNASSKLVLRTSSVARIVRSELDAITPEGAKRFRLAGNVAAIFQVFLERALRKRLYKGGRVMRLRRAQTLKPSHLDFVDTLEEA